MNHPSEILLASDFSARSDRPLDRALMLAKQMSAKLAIVHVLERGLGEEDMRALAERLRGELPDEARGAELVLRIGSAPEELAAVAAERGSGLIVTGVARYNSLGDYILGTAVDHILRHARVPVLVVRRRPLRPYSRLVVATDCSESSRDALISAARLFPAASLVLLHTFQVPYQGWLRSPDSEREIWDEHRGKLGAFIADPLIPEDVRGRIETSLQEGELNGAAKRCVKTMAADLFVVGTRERGQIAHATMGSAAESLLAVVDVDTLVVRAQPRRI